jgi:acyl-CoA synthetase (AMP-forming)/AMP-acid ligase II/acyl-coenzyme A thioesterase PaaI-like protein
MTTTQPKPAQSYNLADLFESVADVVPDKEAIVAGAERLTYARLEERANRLANWLRARGVGAGAHVGLYLYNGHEFMEALLAIFKLRAVPININYRYVEGELRYLCQNADLVGLIYQPELKSRVDAIAGELPKLALQLQVGQEYEAALAASSPARDFPQRSGEDHYIVYTGGTTGMPRGVVWRHDDVFFAGLQGGNPGGDPVTSPAQIQENARTGDTAMCYLPAAPFIHGAAQWAALIALNCGGKVVLAPGPRFDAARVCKLIGEEQVSVLLLVGDAMARPLAEALAANPGLDTSSLVAIASAGAILSRSVAEELQAALPNTMMLNNFGATETGHQGRATDEGARPRFFMSETSAVLDENLKPVAPGSGIVGKLARRGHLPLGYYNDPQKTAATFIVVDGERWVIPGDMAMVEEDGTITVLGRGAVCINSGGEKIFPEEVEEALKAHPDILDAVVVGVPDPKWMERVTALIQARPGADPAQLTLAAIDAHLRPRIAGYKVPREAYLVAEMQRHPSGKPDYRWAKAEAIARGSSPGAGAEARRDADGSDVMRAWRVGSFETSGAWSATRRIAAAARTLSDHLVRIDVSQDSSAPALDAIAAVLEAELAKLAALPQLDTRTAFIGKSYHARQPEFMDRGTLIGLCNPVSPPMILSAEGDTAIGHATFGPRFEGMPGHLHGGVLAAAFDQMFGYVGVMRRVPALTGNITVHYRKPTPIGVEIRFEATVERVEGRKSFVKGRCLAGGEVTAEAEGLFVLINGEWFQQLMRGDS